MTWSAEREDGTVVDRLTVNVRVTSEGVEQPPELRPFVERYPSGTAHLHALSTDGPRTDEDARVVGYLLQYDSSLQLRLLAKPAHVAALAALAGNASAGAISLRVTPDAELSEWDGRMPISLLECEIAVVTGNDSPHKWRDY